jgi:hypothetical protein
MPKLKNLVNAPVRTILLALLWVYQAAISPFIPPACRFYPSCSHYAVEAIERRGVAMGLCLAAWRLLRCHPWSAGGYDPVPEPKQGRGCTHGTAPSLPQHSTP